METIKNIKKQSNNMMKKFITLCLLVGVFLGVGYSGVVYEDDQTITNEDYNNYGKTGIIGNELLITGDAVNDELTFVNTPVFLFLKTANVGETSSLTIDYYDVELDSFFKIDYIIDYDDPIIIELTPQAVGEFIRISITNITGALTYSYLFTNDDDRTSSETITIFTPLINGVVELVEINITMWRAGFYLIIFLVFAGLIAGLFGASFWVIKKTKQLNDESDSKLERD